MNKPGFLLTSLLLLLAAAPVATACANPAVPARFQVISLDIAPAEVAAGEAANVSVAVQNTGGTRGVYTVVLTVDGAKTKSQDLLLDPGATETLAFTLQRDSAGVYKAAVGDKSAKLTVKSKLVAMQAELKYDDGLPRDFILPIKPFTGYLVSFSPGASQFTVNNIRIFGLLFGGRGFSVRDIEVQIWDKDRKVLFTTSFPGKKFPLITYISTNFESLGDWVDVYVPDVKVTGDFFVNVYAGLDTGQGFRMGTDDSVANTHSDLTIRDATGIDSTPGAWPYTISSWYGDKSKVTWMVRVQGKALVPAE